MYSDHSQLWPPPDDAVLWRYMDFTRFVSLLDTGALFFCRPDLLGDPFEGSLSPATPPLLAADPKAGSFTLREVDIRKFVGQARVNCWHMSEFESEAMWRLYAQERKGIAIKTVFARFKEAFVGDETITASMVRYLDYETEGFPFSNLMIPLFHKRVSFQHEQEVRALFVPHLSEDGPDETAGCYCEVDLPKLVEEIVVAPFAEDWFADLVRSLSERYGIGDRVQPSTLSKVPTFTARFLMGQG